MKLASSHGRILASEALFALNQALHSATNTASSRVLFTTNIWSRLAAAFGLLLAVGTAQTLRAQEAGQVVVTNDAVSIISVSDTTLTVANPTAGQVKGGSATTSAAGSVLRITTNQTNRKIQVSRTAVPTGVTVTVAVGTHTSSFTGGTTTTVTTTATDFITGISNLASDLYDASGIPLNYTITQSESTPSGGYNVDFTFTIMAGS